MATRFIFLSYMADAWEWCLNLAICRANDFIIKSIKNYDVYSPRASRFPVFPRGG